MLISNGITDIITAFTDNGRFCQVTSATMPRSYLMCGTHGEFITKLRYAGLSAVMLSTLIPKVKPAIHPNRFQALMIFFFLARASVGY
jgi:hypothetical protein